MSHFTCLVVGHDVDGQLEPYDENTSVEPYKAYWDEAEVKRTVLDLQRREETRRDSDNNEYTYTFPDELVLGEQYTLEDVRRIYVERYNLRYGKEPTATEQVDEATAAALAEDGFDVDEPEEDDQGVYLDDGGIYEWSTYNPKSKWDWYQIGGRWSGYFKLKQHALAGAVVGESGVFDNPPRHDSDQAQKGDIDIAWMRDTAGEAAGEVWEKVNAVIGHLPKAQPWEDFTARVELAEAGGEPYTINEARDDYHGQEAQQALMEWHKTLPDEEKFLGMWEPAGAETFQVPREDYVRIAREEALCPFAWIQDGEWHAPGKMGWFGWSTDDAFTRRVFREEFNAMLDGLPDDELLTLVDLHI